ncbi:MAG: hypothetical protein HC930_17755 [Hydrococcus sp. SU_1_0]|nr:hypothetical protein [Hydrococcus sp. SU_1_0]
MKLIEKIVTTEQELEGFYIVKAILRGVVDVSRLKYKDTVHYLGINLDGKLIKLFAGCISIQTSNVFVL